MGTETNSKGITREQLKEIAATKTPEALQYLVNNADWSDVLPKRSVFLYIRVEQDIIESDEPAPLDEAA